MNEEAAVKESMHLLCVSSLKNNQKKAIMSFLLVNDTFVSLPTGYRKSLMYTMIPYTFDMIRGMPIILTKISIQVLYFFQEAQDLVYNSPQVSIM